MRTQARRSEAPAAQINPDELGPARDLALRRLGIAVARHVDEHQPAAEGEEIELPRPSRRVRGAGKAVRPVRALRRLDFPTFERPAKAISGSVSGGRAPTVAAPATKSHSLAKSRRPASSAASSGASSPGALFQRRLRRQGHAAPARRMMTHCCRQDSVLFHAQ